MMKRWQTGHCGCRTPHYNTNDRTNNLHLTFNIDFHMATDGTRIQDVNMYCIMCFLLTTIYDINTTQITLCIAYLLAVN